MDIWVTKTTVHVTRIQRLADFVHFLVFKKKKGSHFWQIIYKEEYSSEIWIKHVSRYVALGYIIKKVDLQEEKIIKALKTQVSRHTNLPVRLYIYFIFISLQTALLF